MDGAKIVCYGDLNVDYTGVMARLPEADEELPIEDLTIHCGGAATNVAVALSRLGRTVSFLGCVGSDALGKKMFEELQSEGVDLSQLLLKEGEITGMVISIIDQYGERRLLTHYGANARMTEADVSEKLFDNVTIFHLSSPQLHMVQPLLKLAKEKGLFVSFDPGNLICRHGMAALKPLLAQVNLLFLNRIEFHQLLGDREKPDFSAFFSAGCETVIYKRGKQESLLATAQGVQVAAQGFSVKALDSTGAGDAFAAGYLNAMLKGFSYVQCMREANAMGALAVSARGAKTALPNQNQLQRFLRQHS